MVLMVTEDLTGRFNASEIMKRLAAEVSGTGGGRPDMAQGGGPRVEKIDGVIRSLYAMIEKSGVRSEESE
jgi:alanyl-tRNA synthetase